MYFNRNPCRSGPSIILLAIFIWIYTFIFGLWIGSLRLGCFSTPSCSIFLAVFCLASFLFLPFRLQPAYLEKARKSCMSPANCKTNFVPPYVINSLCYTFEPVIVSFSYHHLVANAIGSDPLPILFKLF